MKPGQPLEALLIGVVNFGGAHCSTYRVEPTAIANVGFYKKWIDQKIRI